MGGQEQKAVEETVDASKAVADAAKSVDGGEAKEAVADAAKEETFLSEAGKEKEGEEKKEEGSVAAVPEKYEFKVPEGMGVDTALVDAVTPIFKELKLTQEQAQKLVDAYAPIVKAREEQNKQAALSQFKEIVNEWGAETQKELGADAMKTKAFAGKAIEKFGSPKLRELLTETGVGNNIEFVRFFAKVGELVSVDSFVDSQKTQPADVDDSILYTNSPQLKK